jgi:signal transduction histidine kinase
MGSGAFEMTRSGNGEPRASVLLVDDTPANLLALSVVLEPLGARLVEARSGEEALEHVRREPFAVVLLDVQMPGLDGFEVARRMRESEHGRDVPIVFMTAIHRDEEYARRGYAVGAADYITKPFDADVLRARVKAFVALFEQQEKVRRAQLATRTRERDLAVRRLVAFERIATAALDAGDLDVLLRELLGVFLSAAEAADSAAVLLRKGDLLEARAVVGLGVPAGGGEPPSLRIGEGFSGAIAAERRPLEIDGRGAPLLRAAFPHAREVWALYGVPLLHEGEVVGVAQIGSTRAHGFCDAEKRLFGAMVERAAWAVSRRRELERHEAERAALLERERAARAEAERANQTKDQFLATISHELRTPLNAILGWATLAQRSAPEHLARALDVIERNARAQARIIEDVLDITRIVSGKLRLELAETSLAEIIHAAVESIRPAAEARGVELSVATAALPRTLGDPERLQQIAWNLLSNGVKFTPKGGRVELTASCEEGEIVMRVADTGQGIDAAFLPHVFEAFRQADGSPARRHGGLGLGLAIVQQLVQAHGGSIDAASAGLGMGTTFTVRLPIRAAPATKDAKVEASAGEPAADARLTGLRVLVVDDEEDAHALLQRALEDHGATVAIAASGEQAFDAIATFAPDVIVSDIGMPGVDGYSLLRSVRMLPPEQGGTTPAVALTAYASAEDSQRAFSAGFQWHLPKPVDLAKLVSLLGHLAAAA